MLVPNYEKHAVKEFERTARTFSHKNALRRVRQTRQKTALTLFNCQIKDLLTK